jgi:hypothetical protein
MKGDKETWCKEIDCDDMGDFLLLLRDVGSPGAASKFVTVSVITCVSPKR